MHVPFQLEFERWEDGERRKKILEAPDRWEVHAAERVKVTVGSVSILAVQRPRHLSGTTGIGVGACLWDGALVLTAYLASGPEHKYVGLKVIELGAGVGVVSVALAKLGACVISTDLKKVLPLLEKNIAENNVELSGSKANGWVVAEELEWGANNSMKKAEILATPPPDMVVAADCCYIDGDGPTPSTKEFVLTCKALCGPKTRVLVASEQRADEVRRCFLEEARKQFSVVKSVSLSKLPLPLQLEYVDLWELRQ